MLRRLFSVLLLVTLCLWTLASSARADAPLRLDCGSRAAVGAFGPDAYYTTGQSYSTTAGIDIRRVSNAAPQAVYQTQNTSGLGITYTLPNFTARNTYVVRLHFAELVYNASNARQMNVSINGVNVLTHFDIYATAGAKNRAYAQDFTAVADSAGKITLVFTAVTGSCCINGIEVLTPPILPGDVPLPGWAEGATPIDSGGAGGAGPSSADGVNLASDVYENNPGADIAARNPVGPSPFSPVRIVLKTPPSATVLPACRWAGRTTTMSLCRQISASPAL